MGEPGFGKPKQSDGTERRRARHMDSLVRKRWVSVRPYHVPRCRRPNWSASDRKNAFRGSEDEVKGVPVSGIRASLPDNSKSFCRCRMRAPLQCLRQQGTKSCLRLPRACARGYVWCRASSALPFASLKLTSPARPRHPGVAFVFYFARSPDDQITRFSVPCNFVPPIADCLSPIARLTTIVATPMRASISSTTTVLALVAVQLAAQTAGIGE